MSPRFDVYYFLVCFNLRCFIQALMSYIGSRKLVRTYYSVLYYKKIGRLCSQVLKKFFFFLERSTKFVNYTILIQEEREREQTHMGRCMLSGLGQEQLRLRASNSALGYGSSYEGTEMRMVVDMFVFCRLLNFYTSITTVPVLCSIINLNPYVHGSFILFSSILWDVDFDRSCISFRTLCTFIYNGDLYG